MPNGVPFMKIAATTALLAVAFLIAAVVLTITGHPDAAAPLYGIATGTLIGSGTTTAQVVTQQKTVTDAATSDATQAAVASAEAAKRAASAVEKMTNPPTDPTKPAA